MPATIHFQAEPIDFDLDDDRLVIAWSGPKAWEAGDVAERVRSALESPLEFPPLRRSVVPGDRVVVATEPELPEARIVLSAVLGALRDGGVESGSVHVLSVGSPRDGWADALPPDVSWSVHDPDDRSDLAYLASTGGGRRVYLNRRLIDADSVVTTGLLGFDPTLGLRGPWSVIFPGLGDAETIRAVRASAGDGPNAAMSESADVNWLLGSPFHVGVLGGRLGAAGVLAGAGPAVRDSARMLVDQSWLLRSPRPAELVVAGIGGPDRAPSLDDLAAGLEAATHLVRRGGKVVALSRAEGPIGPAWGRLLDAEGPDAGLSRLRGAEAEADYAGARRLAKALAHADLYLLSNLRDEDVESLGLIALSRPEEARRLARAADSVALVDRAELVRAELDSVEN